MSIFCPFCGEKLVDDAKFCKNCGKNVESYRKNYDNGPSQPAYQPPVEEKSHTLAIVLGFICAIFIPILGIIFGIYLFTRNDGSNAKKFGIIIIALAVVIWAVSFMTTLFMY